MQRQKRTMKKLLLWTNPASPFEKPVLDTLLQVHDLATQRVGFPAVTLLDALHDVEELHNDMVLFSPIQHAMHVIVDGGFASEHPSHIVHGPRVNCRNQRPDQ